MSGSKKCEQNLKKVPLEKLKGLVAKLMKKCGRRKLKVYRDLEKRSPKETKSRPRKQKINIRIKSRLIINKCERSQKVAINKKCD